MLPPPFGSGREVPSAPSCRRSSASASDANSQHPQSNPCAAATCASPTREPSIRLLLADRHPLLGGRGEEALTQVDRPEQLALLANRKLAYCSNSGSSVSNAVKSWTRSIASRITPSNGTAVTGTRTWMSSPADNCRSSHRTAPARSAGRPACAARRTSLARALEVAAAIRSEQLGASTRSWRADRPSEALAASSAAST